MLRPYHTGPVDLACRRKTQPLLFILLHLLLARFSAAACARGLAFNLCISIGTLILLPNPQQRRFWLTSRTDSSLLVAQRYLRMRLSN